MSEEIEIVKAYLDIERLRLGSRLEVDLEVDGAALPVLIPILSIQPLVENAIKHGISGKTGPGLLRLQVKAREDGLHVTVEDSGVETLMGGHFPERAGANTGVGLSTTSGGGYGSFVSGPERHSRH